MVKKSANNTHQISTFHNQEQHQYRFDIIRQATGQIIEEPKSKKELYFTNLAFVSSKTNLETNNNNDSNHGPSVWSTTSDSESRTSKKTKDKVKNHSKLKIILITILVVAALVIAAIIAITLALTIFKPSPFDKDVCPVCAQNEYCIKSTGMRPTCICKPGYNGSTCQEQSICYYGYVPYTCIKNNSIPISSEDSVNLKPFCCPSNVQITSQCCGIPFIDAINDKNRIIGGTPAQKGNWPWIVSITQVIENGPNEPVKIISNCSGTLINEKYVITAAHCIELSPELIQKNYTIESVLRVHFDFVDKLLLYQLSNVSLYERNVTKAIIHENFDSDLFYNDIAILILDKPIERSTYVDYLCLFNYTLDDSLVYDTKLFVAGWGSIVPEKVNVSYSNILYHVDLDVQNIIECYYILPELADILFNKTTQICAGYKTSENVGKDTCYADSGSPLMVRLKGQWFFYGIVSYGSQSDCAKGPAIYTRVGAYYDWIKSKINYN